MSEQLNIITKKPYSGANQQALEHVKSLKQYDANYWGTFLQYKSLNRSVKKGEKGVVIVKFVDIDRVKNGKREIKKAVRNYCVFNFNQTEPIKYEDKETK